MAKIFFSKKYQAVLCRKCWDKRELTEKQRARRREYLIETGRDLQAFNEGLI